MIDRRTLLTGLASIIAAPAIVRASSLMPIKAWDDLGDWFDPSRGTPLTLLEWSQRLSPEGCFDEIAHLLQQANEVMRDLEWHSIGEWPAGRTVAWRGVSP